MSADSSSFLPPTDSANAPRAIRVLLLEDRKTDAEILVRELRRAGFSPDWQRVETEAGFVTALETPPEIILADYSLPQYDGIRALEVLRERGLDIPFILISGTVGEDIAVGAMKRGADDYLLKDRLARLGSAVSNALENKRLREKRKAAEDEVHKVAKRQSAILNALPAHIALLDSKGIIVAVNESWQRFAAANALQSPDFCLGSSYLTVSEMAGGECSEEAREVAKGLRRVLDGDLPEFSIEYPCHSPNEKRWFRLMATLVHQGDTVGVVVMHVNVTERKFAEEALRVSELEQRQLAERLVMAQAVGNVGSWETNLATMEVIWTEQTHRIFETDPVTFKPTHAEFLQIVHPDDRNAVEIAFLDSVETGGVCSIEHRILLSEGRTKIVEERWRAFKSQDKQPDRAIGTCQDVTERKQAEVALREAEARLRLSVAASNVGIWDWNVVSNEVYFSSEWKSQIGYAEDEISNRFDEWQSRVHPDDLISTLAKVQYALDDSNHGYATEFRLRHKNGTYRWVFAQAQVFRNTAGKTVRFLGCQFDITESRNASEKVRAQVQELQRWQDLTLGREDRIRELKREVNTLLIQQGQSARYASEAAAEKGSPRP
jgi:PAS domain S-box-containing protein